MIEMVWYATLETVKRQLDARESARADPLVVAELEAASRRIDLLTRRSFAPTTATKSYDWPPSDGRGVAVLELDDDWLLSFTAVTTGGGATVPVADVIGYPADGPYTRLEIDLSTDSTWESGDTSQNATTVTGVWGYSADTVVAGETAEAVDISETGIDVSDSSVIGTGSVIKVDSEWMEVTGRTMLSTGQSTTLGTKASDTSMTVGSGAAIHAGEICQVDAEQVEVLSVAGNVCSVRRAVNGTALASHAGATVYAPRTLTVVRASLGSTAATHLTSTAVGVWQPPGPVERLCVAEATSGLLSGVSGWTRKASEDLEALRGQVCDLYRRRARHGAV